MKTRHWTIGAVLTCLAAGLSMYSQADEIWPKVGWVTQNQHDSDIEATSTAVEDFADKILGRIDRNHDEWKCDEYREELNELLEAKLRGDTSVKTSERILTLRDRMDEDSLDCQRFED